MRWYWPMKSCSSPPITAPATVARQCEPTALEYCPSSHTPSRFCRTAASNDTSLVGPIVYARASEKRAREPAIGGEFEHRAPRGDDFARVPADEAQLAGLTLDLHDVHHHVVSVLARREERRDFAFHREPAEWDGCVRAAHAQAVRRCAEARRAAGRTAGSWCTAAGG